MIANALPRPLTAGSVDNAILRANGTDGTILQSSGLIVDDASTATQNNVAMRNDHTGQTNSALVLTPKGTGALIAGPMPDGTATGGNARGANAVDLQTAGRTNANQVASGQYSFVVGQANRATGVGAAICGGTANFASGVSGFDYTFIGGGTSNQATGYNSAVVGGQSNTVSQTNTFIGGGQSNTVANFNSGILGSISSQVSGERSCIFASNDARATTTYTVAYGNQSLSDRLAMHAHASGQFAARGDAQRARFVMRGKTTTNAAVELFLDGSATRLTIPSGKIFAFTINIAGVSSTGGAVAHYMRQYCLKNVLGTCTEVYAPVTIGTDNAAGTSIALSAYDVGAVEALKVEVTGTASTIWRWVASVDAVEIAFGI